MLDEPSSEALSSNTLNVQVCVANSTHVIDYEVSDVETSSCYSTYQHRVEVHFVDNLMFDMYVAWSYDNPLFQVDHSLEWGWIQFTQSADIVQFPIAPVGDVPTTTDYDEDVATSIVVTSIDGMSAFVESRKEPYVAPSC